MSVIKYGDLWGAEVNLGLTEATADGYIYMWQSILQACVN